MLSEDKHELSQILKNINKEKGLDFSQYKEKTIIRRIQSRMRILNLASYKEYLLFLKNNNPEYNNLIDSIAINVTDFFRNPESFEAIENVVIPLIIDSKIKNKHRIIKALSCGCSSGDEPYSLAILFLEKFNNLSEKFILSVIALDIDRASLAEAECHTYSGTKFKEISPKIINKYFDKIDDNKYILKNEIKSLVKFKYQDIVKELLPKYCDIILCRNVLIYFNKKLQEEILLKIYESLNPGGYMVLGMTESLIGEAANFFETIDNRLRIYKKPEKITFAETQKMLGQNDIDKLLNEMLN